MNKKFYVVMWSIISLIIIAVIIGSVVYLKNSIVRQPSKALDVIGALTGKPKTFALIKKVISEPDKTTEKDIKYAIKENSPEPAKSLLGEPTDTDSVKIPKRITTINLDTDFKKTCLRTTTAWRIKKSSLYLGVNINMPIYDKDTIPNYKQMGIGPTILLYW